LTKGGAPVAERRLEECLCWLSFENFFADMLDPPPGLSIDRIKKAERQSLRHVLDAWKTGGANLA
jgi:hypothetical protein